MEKEDLKFQYKIAIDARDKLNENYHKWMTFYYVANGAILVAITTLYTKTEFHNGIFFLGLLGALICMIWNLSCKGYYYWSTSWINLIIDIENKLFEEKDLIYGAFSKTIAEKEKTVWHPLQSKNISTPKLTMIFSLLSFISWTIFSIYVFNNNFHIEQNKLEILTSILIGVVIILMYILLPELVKSREKDKHKLK